MQVNIGKKMATVEISLRDIGNTVYFSNGLTGNIVSMVNNTFPDHPFTVNVNGCLRQYDCFGYPLLDSDPLIIKVVSKPKEKKIIQISTTLSPDTEETWGEHIITALCDDGSVYVKSNDKEWKKLPPIPKD
jgi:hypothetical protein